MSQDNGTCFPPRCARCLVEINPEDAVAYRGKAFHPSCARAMLEEILDQRAQINYLQQQREELLAQWTETDAKLRVIEQELDVRSAEAAVLVEERQYLNNKLDEVRHKLDRLGVVTPATLPSLSASGGPITTVTNAKPSDAIPVEGTKP